MLLHQPTSKMLFRLLMVRLDLEVTSSQKRPHDYKYSKLTQLKNQGRNHFAALQDVELEGL